MKEGLNRVMLMGNLGADPELRYTQGGAAVLNLRLATTETYMDRDRQKRERTDWHTVVVWGKRGEALAQFLSKGSAIFVEGSLRTSSYEGRDGVKKYKTEINARNILLVGGGRGRGRDEGQGPSYDQPPASDHEALPARGGFGDAPAGGPSAGTDSPRSAGGGYGGGDPGGGDPGGGEMGSPPDFDDDDIPF